MTQPEQFFRTRWFEDIPVGEFHVFGNHTFGEKEIIDFGNAYAPYPVHTDMDAARDSLHQGLVASGWHVCAVWMKLMVTYMERYATGVRDGRRNGAGIGFRQMKWLLPVRPGHNLTYTYEIIEKPGKVIKGKWGIIRSRNEAYNQYGELAFTFEIDILAERNPAASG